MKPIQAKIDGDDCLILDFIGSGLSSQNHPVLAVVLLVETGRIVFEFLPRLLLTDGQIHLVQDRST